MRLCLLAALLWPAAAFAVAVGERSPQFSLPSIDIDPEPDASGCALAPLDLRRLTASDPAADSAIIHAVENLPAIVDAEELVGHFQSGSGQKDMGQAEATISALIETSFDVVSRTGSRTGSRTRFEGEGRTQQDRKTVRLNAERSLRTPGPGMNAP